MKNNICFVFSTLCAIFPLACDDNGDEGPSVCQEDSVLGYCTRMAELSGDSPEYTDEYTDFCVSMMNDIVGCVGDQMMLTCECVQNVSSEDEADGTCLPTDYTDERWLEGEELHGGTISTNCNEFCTRRQACIREFPGYDEAGTETADTIEECVISCESHTPEFDDLRLSPSEMTCCQLSLSF